MTERLLQYIWQFQYFNKTGLVTIEGEPVQIISPGQFNTHQGPDFLEAKIRINKTIWAGAVELHINATDWKKHRHQQDKNYRNVILHVVWNDDGENSTMPVLELKSRVPKILLRRYAELMDAASFIACEKMIHTVKAITLDNWKERMLAERLMRKTRSIEEFLSQNNFHWEETFWWLLARNFGMKVNADAFEAIARSLSLKLLAGHRNQLMQLEALLFGQAGLLNEDFLEEYPCLLKKEYLFRQKKNGLQPVPISLLFLRMRPGNFPTVRLAQLAMLLHRSSHLFSKIKEAATLEEVRQQFDITASTYWNSHYCFDELSPLKEKKMGAGMIDNIIINTAVPVLFAYGHYHSEQQYKDKALQWLDETGAENNSIITGFGQAGIKSSHAFDSQSLLELKHEYCDKKRCLDCGIGNAILKPST